MWPSNFNLSVFLENRCFLCDFLKGNSFRKWNPSKSICFPCLIMSPCLPRKKLVREHAFCKGPPLHFARQNQVQWPARMHSLPRPPQVSDDDGNWWNISMVFIYAAFVASKMLGTNLVVFWIWHHGLSIWRISKTKDGMFFEWKVASWKWYVIYLSCVFHVPLCFDPATDID